MKNDIEKQAEKDWYKIMLEMDLYHYANSEPDLDEIENEEELMNEVIQRIDNNSTDLPANEKRCFLCNTVAAGNPYNMGNYECGFLGYNFDYQAVEYLRCLMDLEHLKDKN